MFQRDYIVRLIEQLAKALLAFKRLRKEHRFDDAEDALGEASRSLLGLDVDTLLALPLDHVVTLFSPGGSLDAGRCLVASEILYELGELTAERREEARAYPPRAHALGLVLEAMAHEGRERIPDAERYLALIDALDRALAPYEPSPPIERRRARFHDRNGDYAKAEDILFELAERGDDAAVPLAIELYSRWLTKSDSELESGGLPRAEVEQGLSELRRVSS